MKKILSKKLTLVLALLLAVLGFSTAAQTVSTRPYTKTEWINDAPYQVTDLPDNNNRAKMFIKTNDPQTPQPKKRIANEDAQMVTVNVQLVEHHDIVNYPSVLYAFSEDGNVNESGVNGFKLSVGENTLQAGVYTFKADFSKLKSNNEYVDYYVFKESIPVYEDMTLTFDADEAKNFVQTKVIDSDGNEIQFMHDIAGQGLIGGDECVMGGFTPFVKDGMGYACGGSFVGFGNWRSFNFYISDIDDIALNFQIYFDKDDVIHSVSFYQKGVHEDVVFENDPNDYVEHVIEYKTTPVGLESDSPHYPIVLIASCDGAAGGKEIYRNVADGKLKCRFGTSHFDPAFPLKYLIGLSDYAYIDNMDEEVYSKTWALPIYNIDGELRVVNSGYLSYGPTQFNNYELDGEMLYLNGFQYPGHPAFSYPVSQKNADVLNNNCPIMRTYAYVYMDDEVAMIQGRTKSLGRFGELRESDNKVITSIVKLDDNESEMGADFIVFSQDPNSGIIEATLTNENVDVDGIPGKNLSQIYIDLAREDKAPPTLTMLHFRDNEGLVTDRFATSDIGNIELSAEDIYLTWKQDIDLTFYQINSAITVEVSYSPYGEDNWNEIAVEENPSLFFLPEMGNFFHGSLEGVTGQAYEGWFDLKVKVTDAAGNWQEQVISPAFRIDELAYSGIATPLGDNAREVARYNLAGQRVDSDAKGVVIVRMSDGTARKILVP
ncbi:MAG: hypothetical protein IJ160_14340 [Muribaculaceae bacterium]|nr:hypothetical protein [Muribaculaceae bacterium]